MKKPNTSNRTFVLFLLTLVYGFNFIDRQIVGILAPFIQADLGITNTQLGLLLGFAFGLFYTLVSIPIAYFADRMNRVGIVTISLAVWSGFTAELHAYIFGPYGGWCRRSRRVAALAFHYFRFIR